MTRGEIWSVSLDPTLGREQQGRRPVMIISPSQFNRLGTPLVVPITSGGNFARMAGFAVSLTGTGMETTGVIRCDQPRAVDMQARFGRRIELAPAYIVDDVLARLATLIS
jgi:mRNA interferase ChpB